MQSRDGGKTFSAPLRVNGVEKKAPEGLHALAVASGGVVHLAWLDISERPGPGQDIFYARLENGRLSERVALARWSDLHHLEIFLARTALGTGPVHRNRFPLRARQNTVIRIACGFVIDPPANQAHPGS